MRCEFEEAPNGVVILTRFKVLALSGWSNTQFAYWARRSEAIAVLGSHNEQLAQLAVSLRRRLAAPLETLKGGLVGEQLLTLTGKGIDAIIIDIKDRTGISPFHKGKHSSLQPFKFARGPPDVEPDLYRVPIDMHPIATP